jgi:hypothetical protein
MANTLIIVSMEFKLSHVTVFVQNLKHSFLHFGLITSDHRVVGDGLLKSCLMAFLIVFS